MASNEPIPKTQLLLWSPRPRRSTRPKRAKNKYEVVEELITLRPTMLREELCDEKAQSIINMVEEVAKALPHKSKKKTKGKDDGSPSRTKAHERTLSLVT
jgi:hypothetical protein